MFDLCCDAVTLYGSQLFGGQAETSISEKKSSVGMRRQVQLGGLGIVNKIVYYGMCNDLEIQLIPRLEIKVDSELRYVHVNWN